MKINDISKRDDGRETMSTTTDYSIRLLLADGTLAPAGGEWADTLDDAREIAAAWGHCGIWAPGARAGDGSEPVETTALLPS